MNLPLSCVLLDDEAYALENLQNCVSQSADFEIVGTAASIDDAFRLMVQTQPQTAFMDIRLIGGNVYHLFDRLTKAGISIPATVLVSGYPADAVQALKHYSEHIHYFIEKPFLDEWEKEFQPAFDKLIAHCNVIPQLNTNRKFTFIKNEDFLLRVPTQEMAWAEVFGPRKTCLITDTQQFDLNLTLKQLITKYSELNLVRCSKTHAVNLKRITRIDVVHKEVYVAYCGGEKPIGIGNSYYNDLIESLKEVG